MRELLRIILSLRIWLTGIAFAIMIAIIFLWVRSYSGQDYFNWNIWRISGKRYWQVFLATSSGGFNLSLYDFSVRDSAKAEPQIKKMFSETRLRWGHSDLEGGYLLNPDGSEIAWHRFSTYRVEYAWPPKGGFLVRRSGIIAPLWFPFVCNVAIMVYLVRPYVIRRVRKKRGRCSKCGYDLRASPDRCPECGTRR